MSPKNARLILSFFIAAIVFYFKGLLLAVLALTAVPSILAYLFPERRAGDNGKVLVVTGLALALFLGAEFLAETRAVRLSLISAGVALMVLLALAPLVPMMRKWAALGSRT